MIRTIRDHDGERPQVAAQTVDAIRCLVEELCGRGGIAGRPYDAEYRLVEELCADLRWSDRE